MNKGSPINGWYGKLPCAGDFVGRSLRHDVHARVEEWIGNGLIQLRYRFPDWQYLFAQSPMWSFVLPAGVLGPEPLLGCLAPSSDRVGRHFPLIALRALTSSVSLDLDMPPNGRWHAAMTELIVDAHAESLSVDAFDEEFARLSASRVNGNHTQVSASEPTDSVGDIFAVLGGNGSGAMSSLVAPTKGEVPFQFSWPELLTLFDPSGSRSFWWTVGGGAVSKRLAHEGALTSHLFITLFAQAMHPQNNTDRV
jgi:type VI secretion system protein ImpM